MRIILTTLLFLTFHMDAQEFSTKPSIKVYRQNFKNSNKIWRKYEFYLSGKEKIKHGRDYTSHSNGKKHVQKHWKNNKLHGTFKAWDKKGQLIKSGVLSMENLKAIRKSGIQTESPNQLPHIPMAEFMV